ncbi:MAG: hypothetical protein Kow00121_55810 [Elainellaceae cyanobacterium]
MLVSMSESLPKTCSPLLTDLSLEGTIDLTKQMHERITQLQQALEVEYTLRRISETIRASLDEVQILEKAVQELRLVLKTDCYAMSVSAFDQPILVPASSSQNADSSSQTQVLLRSHNPDIEQQLQSGASLQFCFNSGLFQEQSTLFACPIADKDESFGSLWIVHKISETRLETLTDLEIHFVQQVAKQCAIAIQQSRFYQATQNQIAALQQLNEAKDNFLNQVTHDLRSPLANMRLAISLLEQQLTIGQSNCNYISQQSSAYTTTLTHLEILQAECEREIAFVNDLLDLQCLASEQQSNLIDAIELEDWLTDLIELFTDRLQQRQLTLELHIEPALPTLTSNSANLHRLLTELLHNACKYTPPGETIALSVSSQLESVQIKVSNSGVEIPTEELPRVFDKFYRIPGGDRWEQGGTGLGLALVKAMVTHLGGSIDVESGSRQTCFVIQLPLQRSV